MGLTGQIDPARIGRILREDFADDVRQNFIVVFRCLQCEEEHHELTLRAEFNEIVIKLESGLC